MYIRYSLGTALLLVGCTSKTTEGGRDDESSGSAPIAKITAPVPGETIRDGALFIARGLATDEDEDSETLTALWFIGDEEVPRECPQGPTPDSAGLTQCDVSFSFDKPSIRLQVTDTDGNISVDEVTIDLEEAEAPVVSITAPEDDSEFRTNDLITFVGNVSDGEDNPEGLGVWWDSDLQGLLDLSHTVASYGTVSGSGYLEPGQHTVRLWAQDTSGRESSDEVVVKVYEPATAPLIAIVEPADDANLTLGDVVVFRANVMDERDAPETIGISWTSSLDGTLGTDSATSDGAALLPISTLSEGSHAITVLATDSDGLTASDIVVVHVSEDPIEDTGTP